LGEGGKMIFKYKNLLYGCFALVALLCISCASTVFMKDGERKIPDDYAGIAPWDGRTLTETDMALVNDIGATWFRRTFRWSGIEHNRGEWNFSEYDGYVALGNRFNKKHMAILAYDVSWLPHSKPDHISKEDLPLYLEYVRQTVQHYRGKVDVWEIWNEPNLSRFWKGSREDFFTLVKETAKVIRESDPKATIAACGFFRVPSGLIKKMFAQGVFTNIDLISFHPYAVNATASVRLYDRLEKLVRELGFQGQIIASEAGYPTRGLYPTVVSEKKYPARIIKILSGLAAHGAHRIFWYELFDEYNVGQEKSKMNSEDFFGLVYPDYSYKKGAYAYALCAKHLAGTTYMPNYLKKTHGIVSMYFQKLSGKNVLILWKEGGGSASVRLLMPGTNQIMHDISSMDTVSLQSEVDIKITQAPLFFTWDAVSGKAQTPAFIN
jgi:hypothetical protein